MGVRGKTAVRAARLDSWFDASGLVRVDESEGGDASTATRGPRMQWGVAAALIIGIAVVVNVATRASSRTQQHQRQIAAANYARVKTGFSHAQVRQVFGGHPEEIGTARAPGFFEECWTYDQAAGPDYQVCFQHGRVTRKVRLGS